MTPYRQFPEPVDTSFPRPPTTIVDREGREITIDQFDVTYRLALIEMYIDFDQAQRAQGIPPSDPDRVEPWISTIIDQGVHVIALHDERVVGHAMLVPDSDGTHELAIFVHQDHQRAGIGRELLEHLLGAGEASGITRIWLTVERWNMPAIELYRSVGFETIQTDRFDLEMAMVLDDGP